MLVCISDEAGPNELVSRARTCGFTDQLEPLRMPDQGVLISYLCSVYLLIIFIFLFLPTADSLQIYERPTISFRL
jgi:hypothetical protein